MSIQFVYNSTVGLISVKQCHILVLGSRFCTAGRIKLLHLDLICYLAIQQAQLMITLMLFWRRFLLHQKSFKLACRQFLDIFIWYPSCHKEDWCYQWSTEDANHDLLNFENCQPWKPWSFNYVGRTIMTTCYVKFLGIWKKNLMSWGDILRFVRKEAKFEIRTKCNYNLWRPTFPPKNWSHITDFEFIKLKWPSINVVKNLNAITNWTQKFNQHTTNHSNTNTQTHTRHTQTHTHTYTLNMYVCTYLYVCIYIHIFRYKYIYIYAF